MKNVNATLLMCAEIKTNENSTDSLHQIYDGIAFPENTEKFILEEFNLLFNCSILFDDKFLKDEECVQLNQPYEIMIRLTHAETERSVALHNFRLFVTENDLKICGKKYHELKKILKFTKIELPEGSGEYALKIFIRKSEEDTWYTQAIHGLTIN